MTLTTSLLIIFGVILLLMIAALVGYAVADWAAGREFERVGQPESIIQAMRAELNHRWEAALKASEDDKANKGKPRQTGKSPQDKSRDSHPVTGREGQDERDASAVRVSGHHSPRQR